MVDSPRGADSDFSEVRRAGMLASLRRCRKMVDSGVEVVNSVEKVQRFWVL